MNNKIYEELQRKYKDYISIDLVTFSYNQLHAQCEAVASELLDNNIAVTSYVVNQRTNKSVIGVEPDNMKDISGISNQPYTYSIIDSVEIIPEDRSVSEVDIIGGNPLSTSTMWGAIAISGTYNGSNALLTCGHGFTVGDVLWASTSGSGTTIGSMTRVNYSTGAYGDYGIATTNSNATLTNKVKYTSSVTLDITSVSPTSAVGTYLYKYGSNSGLAYVEVIETNKTIYPEANNPNFKIYGVSACSIISGNSTGGDSGGPYYRYINGGYSFCGVHHGSSGNYTYFTPYSLISYIGFSAKIN